MSELRATRCLCILAAAFAILAGAEFLHLDAASACCGAARPGEGTGGRPPTGRPPIVRPPTGNTGIEAARRAARDAAERARQQGRTGGSGSTDRRAGGTNSRTQRTPIMSGDLNLSELDTIMTAEANEHWWRDSFVGRVFFGTGAGDASSHGQSSCVGAATARGPDIAARVRQAVASGEIKLDGHTITVGTRSGYPVPRARIPFTEIETGVPSAGGYLPGSLHTYTVVEVKSPGGKQIATFEVDNYVFFGTGSRNINAGGLQTGGARPVNWNDATQQTQVTSTIKPAR